VAASPDNQRVYVTESSGQNLIKIFDRNGNLIGSFSPFGTTQYSRLLFYIAVDATGRIYVVDRFNNSIDLFDANGNQLDGIIAPDMTLSKFVSQHLSGGIPAGTKLGYDGLNLEVLYQLPGQSMQRVKFTPSGANWAPLGIRFDLQGDLIYTDITTGSHSVHIIPAADINAPWLTFNPAIKEFGSMGKGTGQMQFPQSTLTDSKGNFYVSDGNNSRIEVFGPNFAYSTFFGFGSGADGLNLPRGMWLDSKSHLHVADAVGAVIRVYDVSGSTPQFLYTFGEPGADDGQFNYPVDITMDGTGRLYIADRDNDRVQIWSY
jgi:DNA-binding beta-propeller fold protein YncE